jgi:comEA protein
MSFMTRREQYVVLGMVAEFATGLLIFALNRLTFYQNFIDLNPALHAGRRIEDDSAVNVRQPAPSPERGLHADGENTTAVPPVNVNTATLYELESLPGIGRVTALNIINYRTENGLFTEIDDLIHVKGIGEKKLEMLRDRVTIR